LLTIKDPKREEEVTKIVLENLYVLAAGHQIQENSNGEAAPVNVYTLEVTPEQGERLTLAANKGRLQFALRGAMDSDVVLTKGITVPELLEAYVLNGSRPVAVKKAKAKSGTVSKKYYKRPGKKTKVTIEMIKGLSISKKEFKL
jgi:pilus assembly protein CpaB